MKQAIRMAFFMYLITRTTIGRGIILMFKCYIRKYNVNSQRVATQNKILLAHLCFICLSVSTKPQ